MQTLDWYLNRLRRMPPGEILWRVRSAARDAIDRYRLPRGLFPQPSALNGCMSGHFEPAFHVSDVEVGGWIGAGPETTEAYWREALAARADEILRHEFTFLGLSRRYLGHPIDWNRDHSLDVPAPLNLASTIDYRDVRETGDCKLVWEPNRHQHLVVLARAFRATGDQAYVHEIVEQLVSWLDQCPFGFGMQWRSPLETGIRLINWVWTLDLIGGIDVLPPEVRSRVLHSAYLHMWEIARKYSKYSSANNHTIGEAAGVFIGASYFDQFSGTAAWQADAKEILEREIIAQTYADGCSREQAFGYHLFVTQFFVFAGVVARRSRTGDFSEAYWDRLESMFEFIAGATEAGGTPPAFGDADDGYVLNLGGSATDAGWLLNVGAPLFQRSDFVRPWATMEPVRWLLGRDVPILGAARRPLASRAFPDAGQYLLQSGAAETGTSVWFDSGELGFGAIAAHGHADALSFTLRAFGRDVLVDSGTYDYFSYPLWRKYFRSTRAHNTVVIDDADQSELRGPFLWGARAVARLVEWNPSEHGGHVAGEHDGYTRLRSPVRHRRRIELDARAGLVIVRDELLSSGTHDVRLYFHLAPDVAVQVGSGNAVRFLLPKGTVSLLIDSALDVHVVHGSEDPILGWVSTAYHVKAPTYTIVAQARIEGHASFTCRFLIAQSSDTRSCDQDWATVRERQSMVSSQGIASSPRVDFWSW